MKFAVDKIEGNVVVLEDIVSSEIKEINIDELSFKPEENDILYFNGTNYVKDELTKDERIRRIKEKMLRLRSIN